MKTFMALFLMSVSLFSSCSQREITTPIASAKSSLQLVSELPPIDTIRWSSNVLPRKRFIDTSSKNLLFANSFYVPRDCYMDTIQITVTNTNGYTSNTALVIDGKIIATLKTPQIDEFGELIFFFRAPHPLLVGNHTFAFFGKSTGILGSNVYYNILKGDFKAKDDYGRNIIIMGLPVIKKRIFRY